MSKMENRVRRNLSRDSRLVRLVGRPETPAVMEMAMIVNCLAKRSFSFSSPSSFRHRSGFGMDIACSQETASGRVLVGWSDSSLAVRAILSVKNIVDSASPFHAASSSFPGINRDEPLRMKIGPHHPQTGSAPMLQIGQSAREN
jgi:hypothetical protein